MRYFWPSRRLVGDVRSRCGKAERMPMEGGKVLGPVETVVKLQVTFLQAPL